VKLLLDEMYPARLAEALRGANIEAVTVIELALAGRSDLDVFATAVVVVAVRGVLSNVTVAAPSPRELGQACGRYVLPDASLTSVLSLLLGSISVAVLLLAVRSAVSQLRASRRFLRELGPLAKDTTPQGARIF